MSKRRDGEGVGLKRRAALLSRRLCAVRAQVVVAAGSPALEEHVAYGTTHDGLAANIACATGVISLCERALLHDVSLRTNWWNACTAFGAVVEAARTGAATIVEEAVVTTENRFVAKEARAIGTRSCVKVELHQSVTRAALVNFKLPCTSLDHSETG